MLCSNQQALGQIWPFLRSEPPVLVDWLPWSHAFGGNHNLNQVLAFGGTLHIDDGRPRRSFFERTIAALREVPPTVHYNVRSAAVRDGGSRGDPRCRGRPARRPGEPHESGGRLGVGGAQFARCLTSNGGTF